MSLINEALKKAQQLRAAETASTDASAEPSESGTSVVPRPAPRSARAVALITLGSGLTLLSAALLAYYFFALPASTVVMGSAWPRTKPATARELVPASPLPPVEQSPPSAGPTPTAPTAPVATAENPVAPLPPAPPASDTGSTSPQSPAAPTSSSTGAGATSPSPAMTTPPERIAEAAPPKTNEPARAFIDGMRVMGIRAAGEESRVLLNGRHYRINDIVERNLGLRLVKVEPNCITLEDPTGAVYVKFF